MVKVLQKNSNSFKTSLSDSELLINTDRTKLIQILINIIGNAFKFTKEGVVSFDIKQSYDNGRNWILLSYSQMWCMESWSSGVPLTFDCFLINAINEFYAVDDIG